MKITETDCETIPDMWEAILKYADHDIMTQEIFKKASIANMSREQAAIALAYYGLKKAEALLNEKIEALMFKRMPHELIH